MRIYANPTLAGVRSGREQQAGDSMALFFDAKAIVLANGKLPIC